MAEKVKVSREVAEFIESYEENNGGIPGWEDYLIRDHTESFARNFAGVNEEAMCMKDITPMQLAKMLINGYEIEESPEEVLLERYVQNGKNRIKAIREKDAYQEGFTLGYLMGVKDGLNCAGKEIKGIND